MTGRFDADAGDSKPWDDDPEMQRKLEHAGWRFAQLIGIVDTDTVSRDEAAADREKYQHFIHRDEQQRPIWDVKEATTFVAELTGYDRRACAMWLDYDWYDGGEK